MHKFTSVELCSIYKEKLREFPLGADIYVYRSLILLHLSEALAAVNGSVLSGLEGDLCFLAAVSANSVIHLPALSGRILSCVTAILAANGLVGEAFLSKKLLLACGEYELISAILTY